MDDQVATKSWDIPYLRSKLAGRNVLVVKHREPRLYWDPSAGLPLQPRSSRSSPTARSCGGDAGYSYLQDDVNSFPFIRNDYRLPAMMEEKGIVAREVLAERRAADYPTALRRRRDIPLGRPRLEALPHLRPGVRRYYPFPFKTTAPFISQLDPDNVDLDRFPRFRQVEPVDFQLKEGEILYLPAFWWHQVYSEAQVNISVNFVWWASKAKNLRFLRSSRARAGTSSSSTGRREPRRRPRAPRPRPALP